jgi:hypothetical protein
MLVEVSTLLQEMFMDKRHILERVEMHILVVCQDEYDIWATRSVSKDILLCRGEADEGQEKSRDPEALHP